MSSQARGPAKLDVGAGGSPPGPDSTWEAETTFSKMDERLASMETKILNALELNHKLIQEQNQKMAEQEETIQQLQSAVDARFKELSSKVTGLSKGWALSNTKKKTPAVTKKESEDEGDEENPTLEKVEELMAIIEQKCIPYLEMCETTDNTINEKIIPALTKLEGDQDLGSSIKNLNEKIDTLLDGDTEANKLIETIIPNIEQIKQNVSNLEGGKSDAKTSEDISKIKSTLEKIYRNQKEESVSSVKEKVKDLGHDIGKVLRCSEDMKEYVKDIRDDLEENTKKVDEYSKRGIARGKVLDTIEKHVASKKKRGSDSDSSDDERVYNRGNDRSRSSRDGSREGGRIVRSSSNNSGISKTKEQQFESLLVQINGSIDILSERINKVCPSELIETTLLPSLAKIERHVGSLVGGNSGGGGSWTKVGGPTSDPSSGTKWTYDDTGKRRETSDREDSLAKKFRKKRRRRSGSSSNSESEGERDKKDNDIERQVATIGIAVNGLKEKIDMFVKTNKKSCKNVEDTTKTVLDRVGEMTLGVQVIAENLDNVNDVSKKIESLDGISTLMDRMAGVPKALDKLDNLTGMEERLAMLPQMERSVTNVQQLVTELVGRPVERMDGGRRGGDLPGEEMEDIQAQLKKMEADIPTKLCEFVSVVENLHSEMAKKVDKLSNKMMDRVGGGSNPLLMPKLDDILKRVKRLENLNSAFADNDIKMIGTLKSLEKTQKTEIVPLLQMGGMGGGGETPGTPGGSSEGRVSDVRLGALTGILSQIQPKLDDLYIRVLPTLEEIKSRQKDEIKSRQKDEEMENLREREDKDHIQKILDIVEDLREERPSGLDRRLSEGLGSGDMEGIVRLVRDVEQMIQENEGKMEQVLKALVDVRTCTAKEANFGRLEHKLEEAIHGGMGRIEPDTLNKIHNKINSILTSCSKEEKEMKKVLDGVNELRSNSSCDAKTLSQVNTALQGMKAAASSHDNKMTTAVSGLEDKIDNIFKGNGEDGESNCLDEILAKREEELLSSIEKMLTKMEDEMFDNVEKVVKQVGDNVTNRVGMTEDGINTDLNRIMDKLNNVSVKAPPKAPVKDAGNVKEEQEEMDEENVDKVVTNLSSQMDDVHDLIAGVEERIVTALKDVKQAVSNHDKHVAGSINKVAVLQRKVVEEMSKLDVAAELLAIEGRLHNVIKEERENVADKLEGSGDGESSVKLDAMSSKIDKLAKNIARVKYLVDATDEESDGGGGTKKVGPGRRSIKKDKADDGKDENVIDNAKMEALLSSFEKRQGDLFTEGCKTQDKALLELKKSLCEVTKKLGTLEEGVTSVNVCLEEDLTGTGDTLADIVKNVDNIKESILKQTSCLTEGLDKIDGKMVQSSALEKIEQRMATGLALDRMSGKILCKIENSSGLGGGGSGGGGGGSGGGIDEDSLRKIDKKINELKDPLGEVVRKIGEMKDPMGEVVKNVKEINNAEGRIIKKISELSDLVATSSALEKTSNDVIDQLDKVLAGITEIPNEFGAQAAAMEENLCVNVVGAVRDAGKDNWTDLFNQMDHFEGRLAIVKRYCKYGRIRGGSKGGTDDGNDDDEEDVALETVVKDIQRVSDKLEDLSKAMENGVTAGNNSEPSPIKGSSREQLSMALLLTEIRKRADTDSVSKLHTDMFKSIHNVQRRLLEEQARLVTKLSEARLESKTPSYGTVLIESLNKVRQTQATILDGQDKSVIAQSDLNKVLSTVINAIEETHKLLDAKQNKGGGQMVGRLADLCDDLANAVTGLLSLQNQAACNNSTSLETLDELIKNCGEIPHIQVDESKDEGRKRTSQGGGRAGPPAKRRSLAPRVSTRISEKTEHGSDDQGDESGDESSADTPQRTSASKSNKLAVDKKTRRSGRIRASKDEEADGNTEKDSESAFGDDIEIVDEINSCPPMVYKVKEEDVDDKEKGEKVKTAGEKDSKGMKRKEDKEPRAGRKK